MERTVESLLSCPTAVRYRSAERRSKTRSAFRSMETNFPVASTVKSSHCSTMTAVVPSPKWLRSTRFAAASQSGTESARLTRPGGTQTTRTAPRNRHTRAAPENLLPAENHDFLIVFGNVIEELPGVQIIRSGVDQRLFQVKSARTSDCVSVLSAGVRKTSQVIFDLHFFG